MSADPKAPGKPQPDERHETRDAPPGRIFAILAILVVLGLAIQFAVRRFEQRLARLPAKTDAWMPVGNGPGVSSPPSGTPLLQVAPAEDLRAFRACEETELQTYGWIDKTNGVVRIPVERAMELVLKEGLPTRSPAVPEQPGPTSQQLMEQRAAERQPGNGAAQ